MNARQPKPTVAVVVQASSTLLLDLELPQTTAFEAFEEQLETALDRLEARFRTFVTHESMAGSIGR